MVGFPTGQSGTGVPGAFGGFAAGGFGLELGFGFAGGVELGSGVVAPASVVVSGELVVVVVSVVVVGVGNGTVSFGIVGGGPGGNSHSSFPGSPSFPLVGTIPGGQRSPGGVSGGQLGAH